MIGGGNTLTVTASSAVGLVAMALTCTRLRVGDGWKADDTVTREIRLNKKKFMMSLFDSLMHYTPVFLECDNFFIFF